MLGYLDFGVLCVFFFLFLFLFLFARSQHIFLDEKDAKISTM